MAWKTLRLAGLLGFCESAWREIKVKRNPIGLILDTPQSSSVSSLPSNPYDPENAKATGFCGARPVVWMFFQTLHPLHACGSYRLTHSHRCGGDCRGRFHGSGPCLF